MNNVRHVKSPLTDEKTTGQLDKKYLWPRDSTSTCRPVVSPLPIPTACHTVSLPLWHSATRLLLRLLVPASSCIFIEARLLRFFLSLSLCLAWPTYTFSQ